MPDRGDSGEDPTGEIEIGDGALSLSPGGGLLGGIRPPRDEDVLVEDEVVLYKERRHWISLWRVAVETAAALWLAAALRYSPGYGLTRAEWVITLAAIAVLVAYVRRNTLWKVVVRGLLLALLAFALGLPPSGVVILAAIAFTLRFADEIVQWRWYRHLYVTNRRMVQTRGVFVQDFATMPISKITDVRLRITSLGEYLGYGEFKVESAGQSQALSRIRYLVEPDRFYRIVLRLATNPVSLEDSGF